MLTPTKKQRELLLCSLLLSIFIGLALAYPALAGEYKPLVGIPGLPSDSTRSLSGYINIVYLLTVSIGALLAFLKITIAGVKYAMSDVITDKGEAKKDIMGALFGLAILLIPFIVLNTIYGGLVNLDILGGATRVNVSTSPSGGGAVQVGSGDLENPVASSLYTTVHPRGTIQERYNFTSTPDYSTRCRNNGGNLYYGRGGDNATCIYQKPESFFPDNRVENCISAGQALLKNRSGHYGCASIPAGLSTTPFPPPGE